MGLPCFLLWSFRLSLSLSLSLLSRSPPSLSIPTIELARQAPRGQSQNPHQVFFSFCFEEFSNENGIEMLHLHTKDTYPRYPCLVATREQNKNNTEKWMQIRFGATQDPYANIRGLPAPFPPFLFLIFFLIVSFSISQIYSALFASSRPPYLVGTESAGKAKPSNASRATHSLNEEGQVLRVLRTSLIVSHTRAMPQGAAVGRARLGRKGIGGEKGGWIQLQCKGERELHSSGRAQVNGSR